MFSLIFFTLFTLSQAGVITHDLEDEHGHGKATSYQNIHIEHFHAVPTYIKKEYKHLLEHPIPAGKSAAKLEVHHGGKHDHGYAISDAHNSARGSGLGDHHHEHYGGHETASLGHEADLAGHESGTNGYQVHDQNQELLQQHGHGALQLHAAAAAASAFPQHGGRNLGHGAASAGGFDHEGSSGHYQAAAASVNREQQYGATAVRYQHERRR